MIRNKTKCKEEDYGIWAHGLPFPNITSFSVLHLRPICVEEIHSEATTETVNKIYITEKKAATKKYNTKQSIQQMFNNKNVLKQT